VRLDVAVDDPLRVGGVERVGDLAEQVDRLLGGQRPAVGDPPLEVAPADQPHRDHQLAVLVERVVDGDDARVLEPRREPRLAQEALAEALVVGQVGGDHLQGHRPFQGELGRPVDDSHPAARDQLLDPIPAEGRSDCRFPHTAVIPGRTTNVPPQYREGTFSRARERASGERAAR
jgi:hypothetical protein